MMPDILKEAKLQLLIALGAATPVILYSVGRWYKQWYFAQFRVHYGMFRFDAAYYMFGAWATMMVAISGILVLANLWFRFAVPSSFLARCIAIGLCILALSRLLIFKLEFSPNQFFTTKLLTSAEFSIACIGIAAFLHVVSSRALRRAADDMFMRVLSGSPLLWWIGLFLFWTYCMAAGYALGIYHGRKAIWEGKMGLQWVTIKGESCPWILVEQADDAFVFVFDRERMVSRIVKREDIAEMGPLVTPGTTREEVLKRFERNECRPILEPAADLGCRRPPEGRFQAVDSLWSELPV